MHPEDRPFGTEPLGSSSFPPTPQPPAPQPPMPTPPTPMPPSQSNPLPTFVPPTPAPPLTPPSLPGAQAPLPSGMPEPAPLHMNEAPLPSAPDFPDFPGEYPSSEELFFTPSHFEATPPKRRRKGLRAFLAVLLVLMLTGTGLGVAYFGYGLLDFKQAPQPSTTPLMPEAPQSISIAPGTVPNWESLSAAVSPSVVTINVSAGVNSGVGSGVIYTADGLIITNHHVIDKAQDGAGDIHVTLKDQRIYRGSIVGTDPTSDLAVLKLENPPADLHAASFGTSSDLVVGQPVMAIGAPLGLSNTVTTGIVSALDRPVAVSAKDKSNPDDPFGQLDPAAAGETIVTNAIQIDASINPGNSGGPLFNAQGQVIGINSSIASISQSETGEAGSIGLGFAIPVDLVRSVADQLVTQGHVAHAILGVSISSVSFEADGTNYLGALVNEVSAGGAAQMAGIEKDDVITHIDGKRVASAKALQGIIRSYKAGDEVKVTLYRHGKALDYQVTLQKL